MYSEPGDLYEDDEIEWNDDEHYIADCHERARDMNEMMKQLRGVT